jgi:hypothetical protein
MNTSKFKKIPPIIRNSQISPRRTSQYSPFSNVESDSDETKSTYQADYKKNGVDLCMSKAYRILSHSKNNENKNSNSNNKPLISIQE